MKTYEITAADEPQNRGVRITVHGLSSESWDGTTSCDTTRLIPQYDHDAGVPPYFAVGIAESRCFTLPWAVYTWLYDKCQTSDVLKDGDEMILDHEGQKYVTVVNTWPTCDAAKFFEDAFRVSNGLPTLAEAERARREKSAAERRYEGGW